MTCPYCQGGPVVFVPVTETKTKSRGCVGWALWILLACVTFGLVLLIPLLSNTKTKSKTRTQAVCQACGKSWYV